MLVISVKITHKQRNYLDKLIRDDQMASYGQSFRAMLGFWKRGHAEIERLRRENAVLKAHKRGEFDEYSTANQTSTAI